MDIKRIIDKLTESDVNNLSLEEIEQIKSLRKAQTIHHFLSKISIEDIEEKRESFRTLNLRNLNDEQLFGSVMGLLSFDVEGQSVGILMPCFGTYPSGTRFYRIRKLKAEDHFIPLKDMSKEQDAWEPPSCCVTSLGRLNKKGESLLYTTPQMPNIAVEEMGIKDNERFCLIVYSSKVNVKVSCIGKWYNNPDLTKDENLKMRMIHNLLNDIFSKDVGVGTEYLYRASESITKNFFDYPQEMQDGWCYPSVASKTGYNVCFRPEVARKVLSLVGVQICTVKRVNDDYLFSCQAIAVWNNNKQVFDYYPIDSPICNLLFPEIKIKDDMGVDTM